MFPAAKLGAGKALTPLLPSSAPAGAAALSRRVPSAAVAQAVALGLLPGFFSLPGAGLVFFLLVLGSGLGWRCGVAARKGGIPVVAPCPGSGAQSCIPDTMQRGREGWGQHGVLRTSRSKRTDIVITFGSTLSKYSCSFKDSRHFRGCLWFRGFCLSKAGKK